MSTSPVSAVALALVVSVTASGANLGLAQLQEQALLFAADASDFEDFGDAVAIDGDTIVVGMPDDGADPLADHGSVRIFVRPPGGWAGTPVETARLVSPEPKSRGCFGSSVAVQGDRIVVGEKGFSAWRTEQGALHVYERPSGGWRDGLLPAATLVAQNTKDGSWLGESCAIDGDTIVGGAPFDGFGVGAVFVFVKPDQGWKGLRVESAKMRPSGSAPVGYGHAVDVSGRWVLIGAPAFLPFPPQRGSAVLVPEPAGGWQGNFIPAGGSYGLRSSDSTPGDDFGRSVAIDGDRAVIGSSGKAFVFGRPNWSEVAVLEPGTTVGGFGASLAIDDAIAVVGATDVGFGGIGRAFVYREPFGGWTGTLFPSAELRTSVPAAATSNALGHAIALDGNVVVTGAPSMVLQGVVTGAATLHELPSAKAAVRNGGTNPPSLGATQPLLAGSLDVRVDLASTGHEDALLFAFDTQASVLLGGGQVLLCTDGGAGELFTGAGLLATGPVAAFGIPLPSTLGLSATSMTVQALHVNGVVPFALSNAYDLTLGF